MHVPTYRTHIVTLFLIAARITAAVAQPPDTSSVAVPVSLLRKHIFTLASDSLQGRETGTEGQWKAAQYCTQVFRRHRLGTVFRLDSARRSFIQSYPFTTTEIKPFGFNGVYPTGNVPRPYRRNELAPEPLTAADSSRVLFGHNVAGVYVGTDLKQEVIILSAHYDHLGRSGSQIFHGADDNASGTATILSVAALFDSLASKGIRSRRSLLFVLFSGEEGGLIGSRYFTNHSPIPLNQIVCDINVDMVGRMDYTHRRKQEYCYLIAGRQDNWLRKAAETANQQSVRIILDRAYDTEDDPQRHFYRSDQYNFARLGIPVLFFMDGEHPDYHRPSDTASRINYDVLQKRATLIFQTVWYVANQE